MAIIKKGEAEVMINLLKGAAELFGLCQNRLAIAKSHSALKQLSLPFQDLLMSPSFQIPGLTDNTIPRRLGPKRASKIRFEISYG